MGTSHHHHKKVIKCNVLISWLILLCTWWLKKYIWYIYMELYIVHIIQPASIEKLRARIWWISLGEDKILPQRCGYFYNLCLPYIHTYIFKINLYLCLWQFAQTTHPIIELRLQNLLPAKSWGKSPHNLKVVFHPSLCTKSRFSPSHPNKWFLNNTFWNVLIKNLDWTFFEPENPGEPVWNEIDWIFWGRSHFWVLGTDFFLVRNIEDMVNNDLYLSK